MTEQVRTFDTGATRSADADRPDYEGFLSPLVIERYGLYMQKHRMQADGTLRESDNWQKGLPLATYIKGLWRHFHHLWLRHRGWPVNDPKAAADIQEDLCAIWFNTQGYLHTLLVQDEAALTKLVDVPDRRVGHIDRRVVFSRTLRNERCMDGQRGYVQDNGRRQGDKPWM